MRLEDFVTSQVAMHARIHRGGEGLGRTGGFCHDVFCEAHPCSIGGVDAYLNLLVLLTAPTHIRRHPCLSYNDLVPPTQTHQLATFSACIHKPVIGFFCRLLPVAWRYN